MTALEQAGARVAVLHATGDIPFVTCDNPARPYYPDRVRRIVREPLPGFADQRTEITYPIAPTCCVKVTSNPAYPQFTHDTVGPAQIRKVNSAHAIMADKEIVLSSPNMGVFQSWLKLERIQPIRRP